jgi:hypothetical protein
MAYKINKNRKGHYAFLRTDAPSAAVQEMERLARLHDDVMRVMTIKVDAHEDGPSIQMQKRDERGPSVATAPMAIVPVSIAVTAAIVVATVAASAARSATVVDFGLRKGIHHGKQTLLPPPQGLPVLGRQRAEDRLQGRPSAAALHLRARQDRPGPHHRRLGQEAARTGPAIKRARFLALLPYAVK